MKTMKKVFMTALAVMMAASMTACGDSSSDSSSASDGTIKIGLHYELTGSVADYGTAELKGSELAIKQANEAGGNYTTVVYDNKSDTTESVTLAAQLASDGVAGVVGPATSGTSAATYQIMNDSKVTVISPSATAINQTLNPTSGKVYDYVFRICFEDSYQGAAMAQYAVDTLNKGKAVIYADTSSDYAKGLTDAFSAQFKKLGGTVVSTDYYNKGDTDFNSVLTKFKELDFDVLYIPGYYNEAGLIIKQAREMGIDCEIIGPDGFDSETLIDLAGASNLNKVYYTTAYTTVGASDALQAFIDAYKAEYNEEPGMFAALAYDSTNLLIEAIEKAGSTDPEAVKTAVENIEFDGVTGSFSFDETHTPIKSVLVVTLVDGVQGDAVAVSPDVD